MAKIKQEQEQEHIDDENIFLKTYVNSGILKTFFLSQSFSYC